MIGQNIIFVKLEIYKKLTFFFCWFFFSWNQEEWCFKNEFCIKILLFHTKFINCELEFWLFSTLKVPKLSFGKQRNLTIFEKIYQMIWYACSKNLVKMLTNYYFRVLEGTKFDVESLFLSRLIFFIILNWSEEFQF